MKNFLSGQCKENNPDVQESIQIGPGQYKNPDYYPQKEGISMKGTKFIEEIVDNKVPGPGHYNTKSTLNQNGVSILGKHSQNKSEN